MDKTVSHLLEETIPTRLFYELTRAILLEKGGALPPKEIALLLEREGFRLPRRLVKYLLSLWEEGILKKEGTVNLTYREEHTARPLEGEVDKILRSVGKPLSLEKLSQELAIVQRRLPQIYLQSLPPLLSSRPKKYFIIGDKVGLRDWLLQVEEGASEEEVVFLNFLPEEIPSLESWLPFSSFLKGENILEETKALLREKPAIPHKVLAFLVWRAKGTVDSLELMEKMLEEGSFFMMKPASWLNREQITSLLQNLRTIEIPPGAVEPEPFVFGEEEKEILLSYLREKGRIAVKRAAEELFELEDVDIEQVKTTLSDFLKERGFLWLGDDRWTEAEKLPMDILALPSEVEIDRKFQYEDLDGEQLEVELSDEGLENALPKLLKDPFVQDTGDEEDIEIAKPNEEIQLVIPYHHYISGTLPVRKWEKAFYPSEPHLQLLTFLTDKGEELELWFNRDLPLIFGLRDWYEKNLPPSGALLKIRKEQEIYKIIWEGKTHPLLTIPPKRLNDLLKLREELKEQPTVEIVQTLLEYHKKAHFFTILSEVNVIRRTPKRRVASILSIFPCFYMRGKEEGIFYYDSAKRDEVMKRAKKKYLITN